jgi:hypothetical protein
MSGISVIYPMGLDKIINISIFRFPKGINTILSDTDSRVVSYKNKFYNQALAMCKKS